jgi:hypothetical protein
MATTTNISSEFKGVQAGTLLLESLGYSSTLGQEVITIIPGVIGSGNLPKLSLSGSFSSDAGCGFDAGGTVNYTEKNIVLKPLKMDFELCKKDFQGTTFASAKANGVSSDAPIPAEIQENIIEGMLLHTGKNIETDIWQGTNTATSLNGFLPQFVADAEVIDVTITAVTKSNVVEQIDLVWDSVPAEIADEDDLFIAVSRNVAKAYKQAQASMGNNTTVGDKEMDYIGNKMVQLSGLPANTILVFRKSNLGYLTGLKDEETRVRISDIDAIDLSGNVLGQVAFKAEVGYRFGSEIVYGRTA